MGKQIKLPNIDFVKVGNTLVESGKTAGAFVKNHATEFLAGALAGVTIDNIRIRMGRKKDKKCSSGNTSFPALGGIIAKRSSANGECFVAT